jgi:hypothetical protein
MASEMPYSAHNPCARGKQWRYLLRIVETAQIDTTVDRLHVVGRDTTGNEHLSYSFGYSHVMYLGKGIFPAAQQVADRGKIDAS